MLRSGRQDLHDLRERFPPAVAHPVASAVERGGCFHPESLLDRGVRPDPKIGGRPAGVRDPASMEDLSQWTLRFQNKLSGRGGESVKVDGDGAELDGFSRIGRFQNDFATVKITVPQSGKRTDPDGSPVKVFQRRRHVASVNEQSFVGLRNAGSRESRDPGEGESRGGVAVGQGGQVFGRCGHVTLGQGEGRDASNRDNSGDLRHPMRYYPRPAN